MRQILLFIVLVFLSIAKLLAQDTIFCKIQRGCQITFTKSGYHIYALIHKGKTGQTDTVFCYKYGAYLGTKIQDAAIFDNIFMCVYEGSDGMFFSNHKFEKNTWTPIVGGYFFFFAQREKHDYQVSILTKEKVVVSKGGKKLIYRFDHVKKTVSVSKKINFD